MLTTRASWTTWWVQRSSDLATYWILLSYLFPHCCLPAVRSSTAVQVFLTASATLREQVALPFPKLQTASLGPEAAAATAAAAAAAELHTFNAVPPVAFPLFLTTKQYLHMLDGTLKDPFFPR